MASVNKKNLEEIIELFKSEPSLWKTKSDNYKNKIEKNKAWNNLLEKFKEFDSDATVDTVKKKNGLRTSYRRELHKVRRSEKSGAGVDDVYEPSLWYFDSLDFLRDQEIQIEGISTFDDCIEIETPCSSKKRKSDESIFLQKAVEHLENSSKIPTKDDADIYAESWAVTFRKLDAEQRIFAKRIIDDTLMQGQLGRLSYSSCVDLRGQLYGHTMPQVQQFCPRNSTPFSASTESFTQQSPTQFTDDSSSTIHIISNNVIRQPNSFQQLFNSTEYE